MLYENYIRVLYIDLTKKKIRFENRTDIFDFLGGSGVSSQIFSELVKPDKDAFDPEQPIVFAIGPMSTIYHACTKVTCSFRSPVTGEYGESHAGGRLAMAIRLAGIDAFVITGASADPIYITIKPDDLTFHDAEALWGMPTMDAGRHMREMAGKSGNRSIMRIGPAGTNLVPIANVNVDSYRHFGRLGLGAVFGSKKLMGIVVSGEKDFVIKNPKEYNAIYDQVFNITHNTPAMAKYHELGTPKNVIPLNMINALPTLNLKQSNYEYAKNISGEAFAEEVLLRKVSCTGCPVGCIHLGNLRVMFDKGYEYESTAVSYDHELVFSMGSEVGMKNTTDVLRLIEVAEETGIDGISAGVIAGFITEALEKGILTVNETLVDLKFGDVEGYVKVLNYISNPPNEVYRELGKGLYAFTKNRNDKSYDYALQIGGNEIPGYFTGPANLLGMLTGVRHSHCDNGGYSLDQKIKDGTVDNIVDGIIKEEASRSTMTSLVICLFAREVYEFDLVSKALGVLGINKTPQELEDLGRRILKNKLSIRSKLGFNIDNYPLANRFFETKCPRGLIDNGFMKDVIASYKEKIEKL